MRLICFDLVLWHINHCRLLNVKSILYIRMCGISTLFNFIEPGERAQSIATTLDQSGPGSNGNKGVLRIPQSFSIIGASPSDCLVSYPGHTFGKSYSSAEMQSLYSAAPADWATGEFGILLSSVVGHLYNPSKII